jgi:Tfp pilus assembly major pilin PilA
MCPKNIGLRKVNTKKIYEIFLEKNILTTLVNAITPVNVVIKLVK